VEVNLAAASAVVDVQSRFSVRAGVRADERSPEARKMVAVVRRLVGTVLNEELAELSTVSSQGSARMSSEGSPSRLWCSPVSVTASPRPRCAAPGG
jgi:hypothetical protein